MSKTIRTCEKCKQTMVEGEHWCWPCKTCSGSGYRIKSCLPKFLLGDVWVNSLVSYSCSECMGKGYQILQPNYIEELGCDR